MAGKEVLQMTKTNVMRLLDAAKIPYRAEEYAVDENDLNGMHAAEGIGMKKQFPTFIDETAQLYDEIGVSAGCRGCQVLLDPMQLTDYVNATLCDLTE